MIIRGVPKEDELKFYICVDDKTSNILHMNGFYPKYFNGKKIWYEKNKEILEFMEVNKLEWIH